MSYKERLIELKLPSIKFRQIRGDLIQTFKIVHHIDNLNFSDFFSFNKENQSTRNSNLKLYKEHAYSKSGNNFLSFRVNNYWNSLTESSRSAKSILEFKKGIDRDLKNVMFDYDE